MAQVNREIKQVMVPVERPMYSITDLTPDEFQVIRNALFSMGERKMSMSYDMPVEGGGTQADLARALHSTLPMVKR